MVGEKLAHAHEEAAPVARGVAQFGQQGAVQLRDLEADEGRALVFEHCSGEDALEAAVIGQHAVLVFVIGQRVFDGAAVVVACCLLFLFSPGCRRVFEEAVVLADFGRLARRWQHG